MKKNGFIFTETIIVISIISLTLILLFSSYSYILRKSKEKVYFDTTETIYKTYYLKKQIDYLKPINNNQKSIDYYIANHLKRNGSICEKMGEFNSYECILSIKDPDLYNFKLAFEIEKFYVVNPTEIAKSNKKNEWLNLFDATTIDYLKNSGEYQNIRLMIVKYKKMHDKTNDSYEVYHSSVEV